MPNNKWKLNNNDWNLLLRRIKDKKCTPFLGAGACVPNLPLGSEIAKSWADKYDYPLNDPWDLTQVAQFLAVEKDGMFPKEEIVKLIEKKDPPNFDTQNEIHGTLAALQLPIYITTNYDNFMYLALKKQNENVKREFCRWNQHIKEYSAPCIFESKTDDFEPTSEKPVVYHLHGVDEVHESIVITRDDYLDFLVQINRDFDTIPPRIKEAFAGTSLLFLGYSINDWNFQVVFRHIVENLNRSLKRAHISVQLAPGENDAQKEKAIKYLNSYFKDSRISVYWGTCDEFAEELRTKWEEFNRE